MLTTLLANVNYLLKILENISAIKNIIQTIEIDINHIIMGSQSGEVIHHHDHNDTGLVSVNFRTKNIMNNKDVIFKECDTFIVQ